MVSLNVDEVIFSHQHFWHYEGHWWVVLLESWILKFYLFTMAPSKLTWSCFSICAPFATPIKLVNLLSKTKFNGKGNVYVYDHIIQFILNCNDYDIYESVICRAFTLTLIGLAKDLCWSLLVFSVHIWNEFTRVFMHAFQHYNHEKVCNQLENLHRFEEESFENFLFRYKIICLQFQT